MIDQFINFVIRPPRADYDPDQFLWEKEFSLGGRKYKREDFELKNERGHTLRCSHYTPSSFLDGAPLPCVIYCHGNSGCRADANEAAVVLLSSNITVLTLDFSGSGLSDGDYVSLGWHEKDDLKVVVSYLRSNLKVLHIGLWGRSMGAVTSLLYGAEDPSIAGMVLDSAFSNLFDLMMELVDVYKIRLPKFTIKVAVQYMRHVIQKKAKFDIMRLNCLQVAPKTYIPALFGHAKDDKFIQPNHSDLIYKSYAGDKNIIKFDGDHNSSRPQFYYDSVSIFFYNVLHPPGISPTSSKIEKYYDLGDIKVSAGMDENLLYEIIATLRNVTSDTASSSSVPPSISTVKSAGELLAGIAPIASLNDPLINEGEELSGHDTPQTEIINLAEQVKLLKPFGREEVEEAVKTECDETSQDKQSGENEDCYSCTSSNRESWGRCSSLGSDGEISTDFVGPVRGNQITVDVLATPLRDSQNTVLDSSKDDNKKKAAQVTKKSKRDKFEKLEALSQRLRLCFQKRVNHRRYCSS